MVNPLLFLYNCSMKLRYKCLIFDHDDTVVDSTATVHYPSFLETMKILRPELKMSLEEYIITYCEYGLENFFREKVGLSKEELQFEYESWMKYVREHVPAIYPGIKEILNLQHSLGGIYCVCSHSRKVNIERDYRENNLPMPDLILGADIDKKYWKPSTYSVEYIKEKFNLRNEEIVVIDDLVLGMQMAKNAQVDFISAFWNCYIGEVHKEMKESGYPYFCDIESLKKYLYG